MRCLQEQACATVAVTDSTVTETTNADLTTVDTLYLEAAVVNTTIMNPSPLLSMPGEVRNQISSYVLSGQKHVINESDQVADASNSLTLLRTCRQIYCESHILPYTASTFIMYSRRSLEIWLDNLPRDKRDAVCSLGIRFRGCLARRWTI